MAQVYARRTTRRAATRAGAAPKRRARVQKTYWTPDNIAAWIIIMAFVIVCLNAFSGGASL
jgi:hypothetical protein